MQQIEACAAPVISAHVGKQAVPWMLRIVHAAKGSRRGAARSWHAAGGLLMGVLAGALMQSHSRTVVQEGQRARALSRQQKQGFLQLLWAASAQETSPRPPPALLPHRCDG